MSWDLLAVVSQIAFTGWFALTHWVSMPPLNDLTEEAFPHERRTNIILHLLQLGSIIGFWGQFLWLMWFGVIFWTISLVGHITAWWLPYFFGWPAVFLENAESDNAKSYHFLPIRHNHPVPDLNHCIIGILAVMTFMSCWGALLWME